MIKRYQTLLSIVLILVFAATIHAGVILEKSLTTERSYEPVIVHAVQLKELIGTPIDQLFLYAYHAASGWEPIPFQIDELDTTLQNGLVDSTLREELVFLADDIGDRVSPGDWISDESAQSAGRLELNVVDPFVDESNKIVGAVYLFKSSTLGDAGRSPVSYFNYDYATDYIDGSYYSMRFDSTWYPQDIAVTEQNGGTNNDFYERSKLRLYVYINGLIPLLLEEDWLKKADDFKHTQNPVTRLKRVLDLEIIAPDGTSFGDAFTLTYTHYPYSTRLSGTLNMPANFAAFPPKAIRMSYDLNETVVSANTNFYSGDSIGTINDGLVVDGQIDESANVEVKKNKPGWTMIASDIASMLTVNSVEFTPDSLENYDYVQSLYYWDNASGDPATYNDFENDIDTGDLKSYGDHGMFFSSYKLWGVFKYRTTSYYLPANFSSSSAQTIFRNFQRPLYASTAYEDYAVAVAPQVTGNVPEGFKFAPNYPNPFNPSTTLSFSFPKASQARLVIYNLEGKVVNTLQNGILAAGEHAFLWDGRDSQGNSAGSGIYIASLETPAFRASHKMVLTK